MRKPTEDEVRIIRAMSSMPFSGCVASGPKPNVHEEPLTFGQVADWLESLQRVLREHVIEDRKEQDELNRLRVEMGTLENIIQRAVSKAIKPID